MATTISRKNADFKKNYVGIVNKKGKSPKFVGRKVPSSSGSYVGGSRPNPGGRRKPVRYVEDETLPKEPNDDFRLFYIYHKKPELSIMVPEEVNGEKSSMELFIGASISTISKEAWRRQLPKVPLEESQILKGNGLSLTGRNLSKNIKLNWVSIKKISCNLDGVLSKHQSVFMDELGTMQGVKAKLFVKPKSNRAKFRML